jgi:hypothetical protein
MLLILVVSLLTVAICLVGSFYLLNKLFLCVRLSATLTDGDYYQEANNYTISPVFVFVEDDIARPSFWLVDCWCLRY